MVTRASISVNMAQGSVFFGGKQNPPGSLRSAVKTGGSDTKKAPPAPATRAAGFKSEWWPDSFRNGGRLQIRIPAGFMSEHPAALNRNPHAVGQARRR